MENMVKKVFDSQVKSIDEKNMELTALISTNAVDRYREVVEPEGMNKKNFSKNPVVLWAHSYETPPIGKALWVRKEGNGIVSKVKFANTAMGQEIFNLYKDGFMKAFSIGFIPTKTDFPERDEDEKAHKKPVAIYKEWELLEFSAVPVPANPEAVALAVKKGLIKDDEAPAILEKGFDVENWNRTEESGENDFDDTFDGTSELLDEIDALKQERDSLLFTISEKEKEIERLGLTVYNLNEKLKEKPGVTVGQLGEKVVEIADGVIREYLGKVN